MGRTYLQLWLVKQDGAGGRSILLMLRLKKKNKKKIRRKISKHAYEVSHRKALQIRKNEKEAELEITYSPSMVAYEGCRDVFLLIPQVLLEGGASADGHGAASLDLPIVGRLLKWVRVEGGGEHSKTTLPMGGRPPSKGTISE